MNDWIIDTIVLPGDMEWIDEFTPAMKQAESMSLAGGVIVQRSTQVAGLPITIQTPAGVYVTRQQIADLVALRDDPETDVFTVTHPDAREFQCRFRHGTGLPIDWANEVFRSPPEPEDFWHTLTLRLMTA